MIIAAQPLLGALALALAAAALPANAAVRISEVAAWGNNNTLYDTDWFELTNTGDSSVSISGWKIDDSSKSFAKAVSLSGITRIAAGESVIFTEGSKQASFLNTWFGGQTPAALQVGTYSGNGVGLSTDGDAIYLYDSKGAVQASVSFGTSSTAAPLRTFDNAAGVNGATIAQLSSVGVNGAFVAANGVAEIGSPGSIAAVPEPEAYALLIAGLGLIATVARRRQIR